MRLLVRVCTDYTLNIPSHRYRLAALPDLAGMPVYMRYARSDVVVARVIARIPNLNANTIDLCLHVEHQDLVNRYVIGDGDDMLTEQRLSNNSRRYMSTRSFVVMEYAVHFMLNSEPTRALHRLVFEGNAFSPGARPACVVRDDCAWPLDARYSVDSLKDTQHEYNKSD